MQILHEASRPYSLTSLTEPLSITHFWCFSGHMMDFKLEQLEYLEETTGPTLTVRVNNTLVQIPTSWNVVAVDRETYTIDTIPIASCATHQQEILLFSPLDTKLVTATVQVVDFQESSSIVHPMIPKGCAMVSPIYEGKYHQHMTYYNMVMGPYDLHRYIGGCTVGEILG